MKVVFCECWVERVRVREGEVEKKTSRKGIYRGVEGHYIVRDHLGTGCHSLRVVRFCKVNVQLRDGEEGKLKNVVVGGLRCDPNNDVLPAVAHIGTSALARNRKYQSIRRYSFNSQHSSGSRDNSSNPKEIK